MQKESLLATSGKSNPSAAMPESLQLELTQADVEEDAEANQNAEEEEGKEDLEGELKPDISTRPTFWRVPLLL